MRGAQGGQPCAYLLNITPARPARGRAQVPLIANVCFSTLMTQDELFAVACVLTAIALFSLGAFSARFSNDAWYKAGGLLRRQRVRESERARERESERARERESERQRDRDRDIDRDRES